VWDAKSGSTLKHLEEQYGPHARQRGDEPRPLGDGVLGLAREPALLQVGQRLFARQPCEREPVQGAVEPGARVAPLI